MSGGARKGSFNEAEERARTERCQSCSRRGVSKAVLRTALPGQLSNEGAWWHERSCTERETHP